MRPVAQAAVPKGADITRCVICGQMTRGRGAVVEVLTDRGSRVYQAICENDAANPGAVADVIRDMKQAGQISA